MALGKFLTTAEAAERLGVSTSYISKLISRGRLKARRLGGKVLLVEKASVKRYQQTRRPPGRPPKQGPEESE